MKNFTLNNQQSKIMKHVLMNYLLACKQRKIIINNIPVIDILYYYECKYIKYCILFSIKHNSIDYED